MTDPVTITIGTLAAKALAMAAEAATKGGVGEAVKDAYKALKEKIAQWASGDVAALEKAPTSESRKAVIAEVVDEQSEQDRESLRLLTEALVASLKADAQAIGLDIGSLTNVETHLRKISVTEGIGARIDKASGGRLEVDEINVGPPAKK